MTAEAGCSLSEDQEVAMGREDAAQVESEVPIVADTTVERFVSELGRAMASRTRRADLDWHFKVVNSSEVNAFALPGGFVYVNRGAIEHADRLDELAGIMGHEIGHVVRRHSVADSEGVLNTVRAGIDPEGLPSFFQALLDTQKEQPGAVDAFFSTHPTDASRIAATRREIAQLNPPAGPGLVRDTPEFHAIQARVRALPAPPPPPGAGR